MRSPGSTASQGDAEVQFFGQEFGFDLTDLFVRLHPEAFQQTSLTVDGWLVRVEGCDPMFVTAPAVLSIGHAELVISTPNVPADATTWGRLKSLY